MCMGVGVMWYVVYVHVWCGVCVHAVCSVTIPKGRKQLDHLQHDLSSQGRRSLYPSFSGQKVPHFYPPLYICSILLLLSADDWMPSLLLCGLTVAFNNSSRAQYYPSSHSSNKIFQMVTMCQAVILGTGVTADIKGFLISSRGLIVNKQRYNISGGKNAMKKNEAK